MHDSLMQLISDHPDIFWGLVASFWIGNVLLVILNVPLIGVWVRMLRVPYRYLYASALIFIAIGVYSTRNDQADLAIAGVFGVIGAILLALEFPLSPIVLGFVLGPMLEENFRRAMLLSRGDRGVFVERPVAASFVALSALGVLAQGAAWLRERRRHHRFSSSSPKPSGK